MSDDAPPPNKWIALFASCYMCMTAGGIVYGWPSLLIMLQGEGQYSELCSAAHPPPCAAQENLYHWIWTVASSVSLAASLATGLLLDALGPRVCATVCSVCVLAGCALIGVHDSGRFDSLPAGMILIAAFGPGVQNACVHTSNLFESRSVASSMIIGSFSVSFASFLLLEVLQAALGAARRTLLLGYCVAVALAVVLSLTVMPDKPFAAQKKGAPLLGARDKGDVSPMASSPQAAAATLAVGRARTSTLVTVLLSEAPLHHQVLSRPFFNLMGWITLSVFWANFYIGTVASRLGGGGIVHIVGERQRENYIELFNLLSPAGVLVLPLMGYVVDRVSLALGLLATSLFGIAFTLLLFVPSRAALVGAWCAYTLFRNCVFASLFSALTHYLGFQNLGVLVGLVLLVSGVTCTLQPLIVRLIDDRLDGQYFWVNCLQLGCMCCCLYFPAWAFFRESHLRRTFSAESVTIAVSH